MSLQVYLWDKFRLITVKLFIFVLIKIRGLDFLISSSVGTIFLEYILMHIALILYSFQHLSISLYTSAFKDVRATRKLTSPLFHTKLCATDFGQGVVLQKKHTL